MELQEDGTLKEVDLIKIGMPLDNLSVDANGDIWASGLPKALQAIPAAHNPFTAQAPTTVWRISKTPEGYKTFKALEDRDKKVLTQLSTIEHDVETGRLFIVGKYSQSDPHQYLIFHCTGLDDEARIITDVSRRSICALVDSL